MSKIAVGMRVTTPRGSDSNAALAGKRKELSDATLIRLCDIPLCDLKVMQPSLGGLQHGD